MNFVMVIAVFMFFSSIIIDDLNDDKKEVLAMQQGLQQCVVKLYGYAPITVWQKECK